MGETGYAQEVYQTPFLPITQYKGLEEGLNYIRLTCTLRAEGTDTYIGSMFL